MTPYTLKDANTVVGSCDDCIISLPPLPKTSMTIKVSVSLGYNMVQQSLNTSSSIYHSESISSQVVQLNPGDTTGSSTPFATLTIATDQPLQLELTKDGVAAVFEINSVFVTDSPCDSFLITNPDTATETANVTIAWAGA